MPHSAAKDTKAIPGLDLIPRRSASARLEYALRPRTHIESNDIKKNIVALTQAYLKPSLRASQQMDSFQEMLNAFVQLYPDIFSRETARSRAIFKCAQEYTINIAFKSKRDKWLRRNNGIAKVLNKRHPPISVPSSAEKDLEPDSVIRVNRARHISGFSASHGAQYAPHERVPVQSSRLPIACPQLDQLQMLDPTPSPAISALSTPHPCLSPLPSAYASSIGDHHTLILSDQSQRLPTDFLYRFIDSCDPSMAKFYDTFKKFGCVSETYLRAISRWPVNKIKEFLYMLPPGPSGKMSEMEMLFLANHFQTYPFDC